MITRILALLILIGGPASFAQVDKETQDRANARLADAKARAEQKGLLDAIADMRKRISELNDQVKALNEKVADMEKERRDQEKSIAELKDRVSSIPRKIENPIAADAENANRTNPVEEREVGHGFRCFDVSYKSTSPDYVKFVGQMRSTRFNGVKDAFFVLSAFDEAGHILNTSNFSIQNFDGKGVRSFTASMEVDPLKISSFKIYIDSEFGVYKNREDGQGK